MKLGEIELLAEFDRKTFGTVHAIKQMNLPKKAMRKMYHTTIEKENKTSRSLWE